MHTLVLLIGVIGTCGVLAGVIILGVAVYHAPVAAETEQGLALCPARSESPVGPAEAATGLAVGVVRTRLR